MRRLVTFLLGGVPLCASTEKVVAATFADWRHESARARTAGGRIIVGARSTFALVRALLGCAFQQVPSEARSPFVWRVVVAAVMTVAFFAWLEPQPSRYSTGTLDHVWLNVLFSINIALLLVLVVVFAAEATGRQARSGPSLASGAVLSAALFVTLFLVVPEAYNYVAQRTWSDATWAHVPGGLPPMTSPIRLLIGGPMREVSAAYVTFGILNWLALSLSMWAFVVLAFRVRRFASPHRVRRVVLVWSAILIVLTLTSAIRLAQSYLGPDAFVPSFLIQFTLAAGALTVSSWLSRRTSGLAD